MEINLETLEIEIVDIEPIEGGVQVFARAWSDGQQIGFGKDGTVDIERFRIFNPPILVPDENGDIVLESLDNDGQTQTRTLREDLVSALLIELSTTIVSLKNLHDSSRIVVGKRGNTTSTFYPSMDELVAHFGLNTTWASMRAAAGNFHETAINSSVKIEFSTTSNQYEEIHRHHSHHDTSAIGTDNIISANFQFYVDQFTDQISASSSANSAVVLIESTSDSTPANSDFKSFGTTEFGRTGAQNTMSIGYVTIDLNSSGLSAINKTGTTKLGLKYGWDFDNLTPHTNGATYVSGGEIRIRFYQADQSGTSQDPKLVIEHEAAGGARRIFMVT
jgi:hypothetical protein